VRHAPAAGHPARTLGAARGARTPTWLQSPPSRVQRTGLGDGTTAVVKDLAHLRVPITSRRPHPRILATATSSHSRRASDTTGSTGRSSPIAEPARCSRAITSSALLNARLGRAKRMPATLLHDSGAQDSGTRTTGCSVGVRAPPARSRVTSTASMLCTSPDTPVSALPPELGLKRGPGETSPSRATHSS
jgi:hypothetical protein